MYFFLKGLILGFSIAAPVGPIGVLCIQKTLTYGRLSGFFSGLGAATADTIYGIIAAFGLTIISQFLIAGAFWIRTVGGVFLIYLGMKTFFSKAFDQDRNISHSSLTKDFFSTFFLTLSNPMTILSYVAIFAGLGLCNVTKTYSDSFWLVLGVFFGSALWWFILSEGVTFFRKRISHKIMNGINKLAGIIIVGFGVTALITCI